jgi:hypothetical protein
LRQAFDRLKSRLDDLFTSRGSELFPDPWKARDAFIDVILDRSVESVRRFLEQEVRPGLDDLSIRRALWLLEMQRHGLLMYTSCGWFFDEISGLEATQCLRYAARAIQLARHFEVDFEEEFVRDLARAPSNLPGFRNGQGVWEQLVSPARIDLERVLAHHAISLIYRERQERTAIYCYDLETIDQDVQSRGNTHLAMGRLHVRSRLTWNEAETSFVVVHYGGLDFHAVLGKAPTPTAYERLKQELFQLFASGSLADVTGLIAAEFKGQVHRLGDLFLEEQRRIVGIVLQDRFADYEQSLERLAEPDEDLMDVLGKLRYPIPKATRAAAAIHCDHRLLQEILQLDSDDGLARIKGLLGRGRSWGYQPDRELLREYLTQILKAVVSEIAAATDLPALTGHAGRLVDAAILLEIGLDLWQPQNQLLDAYAEIQAAGDLSASLAEAFAHLLSRLHMSPELLGWRP